MLLAFRRWRGLRKEELEARVKSKQELEALLFAQSKSGDDGHGRSEDPSSANHWHFSEKDEEQLNIQQLRIEIESLPVDGEETWLDCLISSVEREWTDGESVSCALVTCKLALTEVVPL